MKKLLMIFMALICLSANCQTEIKGVANYFVNDRIGTRPDVGTEILIHKISESDTLHDVIQKHVSNQVSYNASLEIAKFSRDKEFLEGVKLKQQNYKGTQILVDSYIDGINQSTETIKITVDGDGNYSADVPPGFYEVISISKNKMNRILNKKVKVEKNKPTIVDFDFGRI